ncbi:MAG: sugar transferase [Clostridia bacterium]|nr:sugar transferase [Clostridia bacterium]
MKIEQLSEDTVKMIPFKKRQKVYLVFKRIFDIVVSLAALCVLIIPFIVIGIIIRCESKGPAVFKQKRVGKGGKPFVIYKFRTMRTEAPSEMAARVFNDADTYITKFGGFLRRFSIDEFPQFINILIGDMSFVGYRPVCLVEEHLNELRGEYGVFRIRPGVTGLAQVMGRDDISHTMKAKYDAEYVNNLSFKVDMWCFFKTFKTVLTGKGNR